MKASKRVPEDALSRIHVPTAQTKKAFTRLDQFMSNAYQTDACRSLFVLGEPGTGKTHLLKLWIAERVKADPSFRAVISEVPPDCTLLGMASQLLEDCGDPDPDYGTIRERTRRVREAAAELDLIVIDETQRLVKGKTANRMESVATWMTNLLNSRLCPLILVGEPSAELIFESGGVNGNDYLDRRSLGPIVIESWTWENEDSRNEYRAFLHTLDRGMAIAYSELGSPHIAQRIHFFSKGRPGQTVRLLEEARTIARSEKRPKLTMDILAEAADRLRNGHSRTQPNPFRVERLQSQDDPSTAPPDVRAPVLWNGRGAGGGK